MPVKVGGGVQDHRSIVNALIQRQPSDAGDDHGPAAGMRRLCSAARAALDASGAGLTLMADDGARGICVASDTAADHLEELQLTLGEGPCIDAYRLRRPVLVPDLATEATARWPAYAPAAHAAGVRAVFAFPLQVGSARLGVLDVFRAESGLLSAEQLLLALTFAEVAVTTMLDGQDRHADPADDGFADALGDRSKLFQAQGMAMVQLGGSLADAMARMRAHAYTHDRPLRDVVADIIDRRLVFTPDRP
jgi:hypothetical protein